MTITGDTAAATFEAAWNDWHIGRERYYGDPLGWVSIVGLYWLTDEFETVADLPGRWRADADTVYVEGVAGIERLEPAEGAPGLYVEAGIAASRSSGEPAPPPCGFTIPSRRTWRATTASRPTHPAHSGVSMAPSRRSSTRRP